MQLVTNERYARADTSVSAQVLKVVAAKPEAFLAGGSGTGGALPFTALAERGWKGPMFGTPALINPDFVRLAGPSAEGLIASTGPITVVEQLADDHPNKKMGLAFKAAHKKANGVDANDNFSPYAFDCWLILADASKRAMATGAKPRTPEFRSALRDAIYSTKEIVGAHAVYNFTPASHTAPIAARSCWSSCRAASGCIISDRPSPSPFEGRGAAGGEGSNVAWFIPFVQARCPTLALPLEDTPERFPMWKPPERISTRRARPWPSARAARSKLFSPLRHRALKLDVAHLGAGHGALARDRGRFRHRRQHRVVRRFAAAGPARSSSRRPASATCQRSAAAHRP